MPARSIDRDIGESVFARLIAIRLELKRGSTGALAGMMRELEALRDFFASATLTAVVDVPFILLTLLLVAIIGGWVVLVPALMVPLVILVGWLTNPALERLSARAMGEGLLKQSVLVEAIGGLETVKAAGAGPLLTRRWLKAVEEHSDSLAAPAPRRRDRRHLRDLGRDHLLCRRGDHRRRHDRQQHADHGRPHRLLDPGRAGDRAACPDLAAADPDDHDPNRLSPDQRDDGAAAGRARRASRSSSPRSTGKIEFRNVAFRYPGAPEPALEGLASRSTPGEHVALLGRVGSGKSTIARLILGLYPPEDGLVMIDGTDHPPARSGRFRRHVGAAMQESVLLTGSVQGEYRARPRPGVDDAELMRVAADFRHPSVHGPDRQRLRSEARRPRRRACPAASGNRSRSPGCWPASRRSRSWTSRLSAMDAQTESGLIERLRGELEKRTLVLITHRPPLLQLVQRIILIDKGRVVADGPRETGAAADHAPAGGRLNHGRNPSRGPDRPDQAAHGLQPAALGNRRASSSSSSSGPRSPSSTGRCAASAG